MVNKRLGKLSIPSKKLTEELTAEMFDWLGLVPLRVEHVQHTGKTEIIGYSQHFEEVRGDLEGYVAPEYHILIGYYETDDATVVTDFDVELAY